MTQPIDFSDQLVVLEFSTTPVGQPELEPLSQNRQVFKIRASGTVGGVLEGKMTESVTEVHSIPPPVHQGIAISFKIDSNQGVIEGYYCGSIHILEDEPKALINAYGQITSVTGSYADLFLADVFVSSEVPRVDGRSTGETGRMTISPRTAKMISKKSRG
jgi:hypothetical protein